MRHIRLNSRMASSNRVFTDCFVLTAADLTETTDDADQSITLMDLDTGDQVLANVVVEVVKPFTPPTSNATLTVALGVTSATTGILAAKSLISAGTAVAAGTGYVSSSGSYAPYSTPSGGKHLLATFGLNDADGALADISAGELRIWCTIPRRQDRDRLGLGGSSGGFAAPPAEPVSPETLALPTGFTWGGPDLTITLNSGTYAVDADPDDYVVTGITKDRYADAVNGNDANDGLTALTPTKTLTNLRTKFGSLTGQKLHVHFLSAGVYPVESAFSGTVDWNMTCDAVSGQAVLAVNGKSGADFAIHESGPAYKCAAYAATAVFDLSNRDATTGAPQKLTAAAGADDNAKLAACIATAGTYHNHSDGACYVHTFDDRAPDADLVATFHSTIGWAFLPQKNTYCKGITFIGGTSGALYINGATAAFNFVFDDCEFLGSASNACRPELDSGFVFMNNCRAYHGALDGFNYHQDGTSTTLCVLEVGCKAASNGTATGDNATTVHDGVRIIRINGSYYGGNRTIHDIGDVPASWNIGCSVDGGAVGWRVGDGGGTIMWLEGCSVGTHATNDAQVSGAGDEIRYRNMDVSGWSVSGTLTPY